MAVLRLAVKNDRPLARACGTCRFYERKYGSGICLMFDSFEPTLERRDYGRCGIEGRHWQPKPPRLGLIGWVRLLLMGEPRHDC